MASKWIAAAKKLAEKQTRIAEASDPVLFKDRPAMQDYFLELEDAEGAPRSQSIMMVKCFDGGVSVGMTDGDAGRWIWKDAPTFQQALTMLEKTLQAGNVKWGKAKEGSQKKGK